VKILPISDVHYEFMHYQEDGKFLDSLGDADVLVVAGDLLMARHLDPTRDIINPLCEKYDDVVYVPGNHEYYSSSIGHVNEVLRVLSYEIQNFHLLEPGKKRVVQGQRFLGGTMWFPDGPFNLMRKNLLNDFRYIKDLTPYIYEHNTQLRAFLQEELEPTDIVVTHHMPSPRSIAPQYATDPGNIFFLSDEEKLISWRQPKLWIHGHTHESFDYKIGDTRIICNPKGYPNEDKPFNRNLIVEV